MQRSVPGESGLNNKEHKDYRNYIRGKKADKFGMRLYNTMNNAAEKLNNEKEKRIAEYNKKVDEYNAKLAAMKEKK